MTTTRPATSKAHDYTVRGQRQRALWITVPLCASGKLQFQTGPRDRGSSASIARPRKLSTLPVRLQRRYAAYLTTYI
eukprot:6194593-Pleurochrysis_carterae.AAC.1